MNEIPKKRTRSNPNPSSSKEIERRSSDEQEERGKQEITRRHDLLALRWEDLQEETILENSKIFPQKIFKTKSLW
jgi:hypothetical protein